MREIHGLSNQAVNVIPFDELGKADAYIVGSSYEDHQSRELHQEAEKLAFLLEATVPGQYILIGTGCYISNDETGEELYDNFNNRLILIKKSVWENYFRDVMMAEWSVYEKYQVAPPDFITGLYEESLNFLPFNSKQFD